ncbi:MAG: mOMP-like family protein [Parachlamydiales bacterium]|nr:mOMP-like family protein [Parachlamydiales bacterium]
MTRSSLLLFSLCAASGLFAQDSEVAMLKTAPCDASSDSRMPKDRVSILESQMKEVLVGSQLGDFGAKAASARPQICSNRLFFKVDTFIWKAFFGGSDYAVTDTTIVSNIMTGNVKRADFRWRWGFRTEAGYHLPHDLWDVVASYTWFHDKADHSVSSKAGGTIVPLIAPFANFAVDATASIRWILHYQNFDLALRRPYFLSRHFSVAPFFGMRNTWINHNYTTHFTNPQGETLPNDVIAHQDFWGIGPVAGMNSEWHMTCHWWIFGSLAGAVLASDYDIRSQMIRTGTAPIDLDADTKRMSPTVQGSLGCGWHMNFNRARNHVALRLLYEGQYWWKQNLTINYTATTYQFTRLGEDLGMHGFTFDMLFDF